MGMTPGDDYEAVVACPTCFDIDNPVGWRFAPKFIRIDVAGIIQCGGVASNPNGSHILTHGAACAWSLQQWPFLFSLWLVDVAPMDFRSLMSIAELNLGKSAFIDTDTLCAVEFANILTIGDCGVVVSHHSGTVTAAWGPGIP